MSHEIICGDARRIPLADKSVHCCVTSPPYFGLRDYGTATWEGGDPACDHKPSSTPTQRGIASSTLGGGKEHTGHKQEGFKSTCPRCGARRVDQQLGLEPTPDEYVAAMVRVFKEVKRVLRDDGTCWLNLGDSFGPGKQLLMMPARVALALQADGWILRSECIWHKPNPMPESVRDRPTKSHEYLFLLTKSPRYYFDNEAVREASSENTHPWKRKDMPETDKLAAVHEGGHRKLRQQEPFSGRNIRSVWTISTRPYKGAHFATMPPKLVEPCIKAGTSERGCCPDCGSPWVRVVERGEIPMTPRRVNLSTTQRNGYPADVERLRPSSLGAGAGGDVPGRTTTTTGWRPSCECHGRMVTITPEPDPADPIWTEARPYKVYVLDGPQPDPIPCTVLDPFAGSGTTGAVAKSLGRSFVGVELNEEYIKLAEARIAGVKSA